MRKFWIVSIEILVFLAIAAVGIWVRSPNVNAPLPLPQEAPALLGAAALGEGLNVSNWPKGVAEKPSPFLVASAMGARFLHGDSGLPTARCYRIFGLTLSILFLAAIPLLGLRRRGGVFETADGPLWAMAFAAVSPALVWSGLLFTPFTGQAFAFLALLVAARAYAQWPSAIAAILFGAIVGVGVANDPNVLWVLLALAPAMAIGVGWTRLCLYWRTLHVIAMLAALAVVWGGFAWMGWRGGPLELPTLGVASEDWLRESAWRLVWLCAGGLSLLAWLGLTIWGGWRNDRRWARLMAAAFPFCLAGSFFFDEGGALAVPLACLTPLMGGVVLSTIPKPWIRGILGCAAFLFLVFCLVRTAGEAWDNSPTRDEQKATVECLAKAHAAPVTHKPRIRILADAQNAWDPEACATLLWPLRAVASSVICDYSYTEADISIVPEETPWEPRQTYIGLAKLREGRVYRIFADRPATTKGGAQ